MAKWLVVYVTLVESSSLLVWSAMKRMPSMALYNSGQWCQWWSVLQRASTLSSVGSWGCCCCCCCCCCNSDGAAVAAGEPWMRHALPKFTASNSLNRQQGGIASRTKPRCESLSINRKERKTIVNTKPGYRIDIGRYSRYQSRVSMISRGLPRLQLVSRIDARK